MRQVYDDVLAAEVEARFADAANNATDIDTAQAVELINEWQTSGDQVLGRYAQLLRLNFIAGMSMEQVSSDMNLTVKTAYRIRQQALVAVRAELDQRN